MWERDTGSGFVCEHGTRCMCLVFRLNSYLVRAICCRTARRLLLLWAVTGGGLLCRPLPVPLPQHIACLVAATNACRAIILQVSPPVVFPYSVGVETDGVLHEFGWSCLLGREGADKREAKACLFSLCSYAAVSGCERLVPSPWRVR